MIRRAVAEDLRALARIHAACFAKAWDQRALGEMLKNPGIIALFATDAFIVARVAADEAEILTLATVPAARRKGLGRALLAAAATQAQDQGATAMFLEVACDNTAARALYEGLGFRNVGTRKSYYEAGEDALILKCDLPLAPLGDGR